MSLLPKLLAIADDAQRERDAERAAWLEARKNGLGGSDAAVIMGVSPWKSPYTLFLEKSGLVEDTVGNNEALYWGNALEPIVREHYAQVTGREVLPGVVMQFSRERPHLFANTDGMIAPCDGRKKPGIYEGKTTSAYNKDDWRDGNVPIGYQVQVQSYMYVTDTEWGSVAVLIGGQQFLWTDVTRNDNFIKSYVRKADEFWKRVENNDPPPMEGHPSERRALAFMYGEAIEGKIVDLPEEADEWAQVLEDSKAAEKEAKAEKSRVETLLRGAMGDALFGRMPDGTGFKLAVEHKKEHMRKATSSRVLRKVKRVP